MPDKKIISYEAAYAAQLPALGAAGQERLRQARLVVVGTGRIGSSCLLFLRGAGVGHTSGCDAQVVEPDNLNGFVFRPADLGKPKVMVIAEWLRGRDSFRFSPVLAPVEAEEVDTHIEAADLVICCANTVSARLATEEKAIRYGKPSMQVGVFDGCDCLGGSIFVRLPENASACAGCLFGAEHTWTPARSLLATVTATLAAIAANMAVSILSGVFAEVFSEANVFYFDLQTYALIQPMSVARRGDCRLCGNPAGVGQ